MTKNFDRYYERNINEIDYYIYDYQSMDKIPENDFECYRRTNEIHKINLELVRYELNNEGRKASVYTVITLDHWFDQCEYDRVDHLLLFMISDVHLLTKWSIVALLRSTYSAKSLLDNWQNFYEISYQVLEEKNYDAKKLLKGLNR